MPVMGNVNGLAIMQGQKLVDVDELWKPDDDKLVTLEWLSEQKWLTKVHDEPTGECEFRRGDLSILWDGEQMLLYVGVTYIPRQVTRVRVRALYRAIKA